MKQIFSDEKESESIQTAFDPQGNLLNTVRKGSRFYC